MKVLLPVLLAISTVTLAQKRSFEAFELGFDGSFNASSIGGVFEIGPKFGFVRHENLVFGPTIRYQRVTSKPPNSGTSFIQNYFGGGFFIHGRYQNTIFGGIEAEVMKSQIVFDTSAVFKKFVPTVFICAGFSREFKGIVRLNAGIYYDIINSLNSPFRSSYKITIKDPTTGQIVNRVPLIYRISFFFPIFKHRDVQDDSEFEESEP